MATFSINQVTHLFAAVGTVSAVEGGYLKEAALPANLGDIVVGNVGGVTPDKINLWIAQKGQGGIVRSDLIKPKNICWIRQIEGATQRQAVKVLKITLDSDVNGGAPIVGQDYILTFTLENFLSPSQEDKYVCHAAARAFANDTAKDVLERIADSLTASLKRMGGDYVPATAVYDNGESALIITEQAPYWEWNKFQWRRNNFKVNVGTITDQNTSLEVLWGKVEDVSDVTSEYFTNGLRVADLECFALGARGSAERLNGWPYNFETKGFLQNTAATDEYDILHIHYFYEGPNANNQKSERDLVIVGATAKIASVATAVGAVLTAAGLSDDMIVEITAD